MSLQPRLQAGQTRPQSAQATERPAHPTQHLDIANACTYHEQHFQPTPAYQDYTAARKASQEGSDRLSQNSFVSNLSLNSSSLLPHEEEGHLGDAERISLMPKRSDVSTAGTSHEPPVCTQLTSPAWRRSGGMLGGGPRPSLMDMGASPVASPFQPPGSALHLAGPELRRSDPVASPFLPSRLSAQQQRHWVEAHDAEPIASPFDPALQRSGLQPGSQDSAEPDKSSAKPGWQSGKPQQAFSELASAPPAASPFTAGWPQVRRRSPLQHPPDDPMALDEGSSLQALDSPPPFREERSAQANAAYLGRSAVGPLGGVPGLPPPRGGSRAQAVEAARSVCFAEPPVGLMAGGTWAKHPSVAQDDVIQDEDMELDLVLEGRRPQPARNAFDLQEPSSPFSGPPNRGVKRPASNTSGFSSWSGGSFPTHPSLPSKPSLAPARFAAQMRGDSPEPAYDAWHGSASQPEEQWTLPKLRSVGGLPPLKSWDLQPCLSPFAVLKGMASHGQLSNASSGLGMAGFETPTSTLTPWRTSQRA